MARSSSGREHRFNAALTALLVAIAAAFADALADDHLAWRRDLSEDRLYSVQPATRELLGQLEDVLAVRAYFTGEARHGPVQIAKRRLVHQLRELASLSRGRMRVSYADPNASTEARVAAARLGIVPVPIQATQGTSEVTQDVYLGLVLRYRGRERRVPFVLPQTFEYTFASELKRLLREEPLVVGFLGRDAEVPALEELPPARFESARGLLERDYEVRTVTGTAEGRAVSEEVDVLIVARPVALHPRAAYAVDRFVQSGGRCLVLADRTLTGGPEPLAVETGLEHVLAAWGAPLLPGHLWDQRSSNALVRGGGGRDGGGRGRSLQYPYWVRITAEGLHEELPVVSRLPGADLFWCHEIGAPEPPPGVERLALATTSEETWRVPEVTSLAVDAEDLNAKAAELLASGPGRARTVACSVSGALPSAFDSAAGVPAPRDPLREARYLDEVRAARAAGEQPPPYPLQTLPATAAGSGHGPGAGPAERRAHVVVVGDADWAADGETWTERNRMLLANLVEWLGLGEEFRALRAAVPRDRRIADYLAEEREALGVSILEGSLSWERAEEMSRREGEAQRRAALRRWRAMGLATGGSVGLVLVLGLAARWALGLGVPRDGRAEEPQHEDQQKDREKLREAAP